MSEYIKDARSRLLAKPKPKRETQYLSTGLTLLDKAIGGGLPLGHFITFTGTASSGKTFLLLQCMAEAASDERFKKYGLRYDRAERGDLMSLETYFPPLVGRLDNADHSETLEEFYESVQDTAKRGRPFFYGLDSEDALRSRLEKEGGYGLEKPKLHSAKIRLAFNSLEKRNSLLVMIKQARQNINPLTAKYRPDTRSGGTAIGFYASVELWFKVKGKIRKKAAKKNRVVGSLLEIHVQKNRVAGRDRAVTIPFFPDLGFDETGSMVRWLAQENAWPCKGKLDEGGTVSGLGMEGTWDYLAEKIEAKGLEGKLREEADTRWEEIEKACAVKRKPRYHAS